MAYRQRVMPEVKEPIIINLAIIQAILGRDHIQLGVELGLAHRLPLTAIQQKRPFFGDLFNTEINPAQAERALPRHQLRPGQRRISRRVTAHHIARRKGHNDLTALNDFDQAEAKFGFCKAVPALTGYKFQCYSVFLNKI